MIIDCVADLHGHYPNLEGGDLLIVAGDLTARDTHSQYLEFLSWLHKQKYKHYIFIAGNHDNLIEMGVAITSHLANTTYLCDSGITLFDDDNAPRQLNQDCIDINDLIPPKLKPIKVWGSPWTKRFEGMNPNCMAFTVEKEEELAQKWQLIPPDTDILVTHSPAYSILDNTFNGEKAGCPWLYKWFMEKGRPKIHVFGHIHEAYGTCNRLINMQSINASHVNEQYKPVNKPIRIEL